MRAVGELLDADPHRVLGDRDPVSRRQAIDEVSAEDVVFSDPDGTVMGRDALERKAAGLRDGAIVELGTASAAPAS